MFAIDRLSSWLKDPLLVVSVVFFLALLFILSSVAAKGSRIGKRRTPDKANIPRTVSNKVNFKTSESTLSSRESQAHIGFKKY